MRAVIMAGGKGTRIASVSGELPKPMLPIMGKPVLEHEIEGLVGQGITDILLTVRHLAPKIMGYFGDGGGVSPSTGKPFGAHIEYYLEEEPLGNAGALVRLRDRLRDDFLLLNGDAMFDIDFWRMVSFHHRSGALATLLTHPNDHPYDSGLVIADEVGSVAQWLAKEDARPRWYRNRVNAGVHVVSPELLWQEFPSGKVDLDRQILKPLAGTGRLFCYDSPEYVKDMGTPERYEQVCRDFERGLVHARSLRNEQRAIFLDRDGTINRHVGFLRDIGDFELLPHVPEAIRLINQSGYLAVIVTNQPVIARGEVTLGQLREIHDKMETLLGQEGAYIDALYYCPHHPDKGFEGEVQELKVDCDCRKPKPGMLLKAAEDYHIDLASSWMIGDGEIDILAGQAAGCRTIQIGEQGVGSLLDAVRLALGEK